MTTKTIPYFVWQAHYKPIQDGQGDKMFETYGNDLLAVKEADPDKVWTLMDGDEGTFIGNGYHHVNRLGYYITEVPCGSTEDIQIID